MLRFVKIGFIVLSMFYIYFQWTEDGQGFQIQYLTLDTWPGNIKSEVLDNKVLSIRVKYQESSIWFESVCFAILWTHDFLSDEKYQSNI